MDGRNPRPRGSSRGQCLTSSVKLRDLGDRWGRNGGINREDFDSSHFIVQRMDGSRNQFLNSAFFLSRESNFGDSKLDTS